MVWTCTQETERMIAELRTEGKRVRPKKRWMDTVKDDRLRWSLCDKDVDDRIRWQFLIELGTRQHSHPSHTR